MKNKYAIKNISTGLFAAADEGGLWLIDENESVFCFLTEKKANEYLEQLKTVFDWNNKWALETEDHGALPISDFKVV